jgi:hypothetical protein
MSQRGPRAPTGEGTAPRKRNGKNSAQRARERERKRPKHDEPAAALALIRAAKGRRPPTRLPKRPATLAKILSTLSYYEAQYLTFQVQELKAGAQHDDLAFDPELARIIIDARLEPLLAALLQHLHDEYRAGRVQNVMDAINRQAGGKAPRRKSTARELADVVIAKLRAQGVPERKLASKAVKSVHLSESQLRKIVRRTAPALRQV